MSTDIAAESVLMAMGWIPEIGSCIRVDGEPFTLTAYLRRDERGRLSHCSREHAQYFGVGVPCCRVVRPGDARYGGAWPAGWSRDLPDYWERVARMLEGLPCDIPEYRPCSQLARRRRGR